MDLPRALQDEDDQHGKEGEGQGDSTKGAEPANDDDDDDGGNQNDSEPMEEGEGEGKGRGLDTTWGDISFGEDGRPRHDGDRDGTDNMEVQMNWNICKYLPEDGSCQTSFQVSVCVCVCVFVSETCMKWVWSKNGCEYNYKCAL